MCIYTINYIKNDRICQWWGSGKIKTKTQKLLLFLNKLDNIKKRESLKRGIVMLDRWVWCDLEMTGLDPEKHRIIEIATIITDSQLNIIAEGPNHVIWQPEEHMQNLDAWIVKHHGESGLLDAVKASKITQEQAESETYKFILGHIKKNESPLCGNSISTDRLFLDKYMPTISGHLHYRNLDVSSIKIASSAWRPDLDGYKKKNNHRALDDIKESIAELRYYQKSVFCKKEAK